MAASDRPFDEDGIEERIAARGGSESRHHRRRAPARFAGDGTVLTDDYAPVDQWLAGGRR